MKKIIKGAVFLAACLVAITTVECREVRADEIDYASMRNDKKVIQSYMNCTICKSLEEHMNHMLYLQGAGNYSDIEATIDANVISDEASSNVVVCAVYYNNDTAYDVAASEEMNMTDTYCNEDMNMYGLSSSSEEMNATNISDMSVVLPDINDVNDPDVSIETAAVTEMAVSSSDTVYGKAMAIADNAAAINESIKMLADTAKLVADDAEQIKNDAKAITLGEETVTQVPESEDVNMVYDEDVHADGYNYELDELYRLVQSEAGCESTECKEMVTGVVLNRVASDRFPNSIHAVIYAPGAFSVVDNNSINRVHPTEDTISAVNAVYYGTKSVPGNIVFFRNRHYFSWCKAEFSIDNTYFSSFRS